MIELHEDLLLGQGNARYCYIHPEDSSKLIKVEKTKDLKKQQNKIDYIYYAYLVSQNADLSFISTCYEWIETNIGTGLVFERIENFDDSEALTFEEVIIQRTISKTTQKLLLKQLKSYLEINSILFIDVSLSNIICKKVSADEWQLIIVDGLGARRLKLQFWLQRKIKMYAHFKIRKQWNVLMENYNKLLIDNNLTKSA